MFADLLILQPTTFCNIDCTYCYLSDRASSRFMSLQTVRNAVECVLRSKYCGPSITVVWHAGEPLVAPKTFYREAFALIKELAPANLTIRNNIQTNGLLIDAEWVEIFIEWQVKIGVSIDGPASIHDRCRIDRRRQGTHGRAMRGVDHLRRRGLDFHCISVVSRAALADPEAFWAFFQSEEIFDVALNIEEAEGTNAASSLDHFEGDLNEALGKFFEVGLKMYLTDSRWRVREFDGLLSLFLGKKQWVPSANYRPQTSRPFGIITVDVDGRFSTFSPELCGVAVKGRPFLFGDVSGLDLDACLVDPYFQDCASEIEAGVALCAQTCGYYSFCHGGCPSNKFSEHGTFISTETQWCRRSKKVLVETMLQVLEREISMPSNVSSGSNPFAKER